YAQHDHGGVCMVCGSVNALYTIIFYHASSNTYIRMGGDCAAKCDMARAGDQENFRVAVNDARRNQAGKPKNRWSTTT
ncbi:hypothetical protein LCGC14_2907560, partial [marine sediment metagenome]